MASSPDLFPLNTLADVEKFFAAQIDSGSDEPDLGLLSIVIGALEHTWTASKNAPVVDVAGMKFDDFDQRSSVANRIHHDSPKI